MQSQNKDRACQTLTKNKYTIYKYKHENTQLPIKYITQETYKYTGTLVTIQLILQKTAANHGASYGPLHEMTRHLNFLISRIPNSAKS